MNPRSASLLLVFTLTAAAAQAQSFNERASFELFAGGNVGMPGSFRGQTQPFETTDPPGTSIYNHLDFSDAYTNRYTAGAELDYALNSRLTTFGRFAYSQFDGAREVVGQFEPAALTPREPIGARFADTNTRELDVGARYTFAPDAKVRPFVGAALGATRLAATRAEIDNVSGVGTTNVELGRASTVFQQRVETGLQFSPMHNLDLRLTAAANHLDGGKRSDDPNLALLGIVNTRGDLRGHWDYPAELGAVWHF
jgi:opacity protein-like surface antigen